MRSERRKPWSVPDYPAKQSTVALVNAGNSIAMAQVEEMRKLRQIMMAQNAAQLTYMQKQKADDDVKKAAGNEKNTKINTTLSQEVLPCFKKPKGCAPKELGATPNWLK